MNPVAKVAAFALALLAIFGGGLALGAAVGPFEDGEPPTHVEHAP
jgi:hypothetical protein